MKQMANTITTGNYNNQKSQSVIQAVRIENYDSVILEAIKELEIYSYDINEILERYNRTSEGKTMALRLARRSTNKIQNRHMHQKMVARLASLCAEKLGLNVGLTKIMAANHDIGHMFYGHGGEWFLSDARKEIGIGGVYVHNATGPKELIYRQRIYDKLIEKIHENYPEITDGELKRIRKSFWIIFDGILSHNGELSEYEFKPNKKKTEADFREEIMRCHTEDEFDKTIMPATIEGCLIRLCDKMAYTPFDMLDGLHEGMLDEIDDEYIAVLTQLGIDENNIREANAEKDMQKRCEKYVHIAMSIQEIFVRSVIENSSKSVIKMDAEVARLMHEIRNLNNKKIIDLEVLQEDHDIIPEAIRVAMERFANIIETETDITKLRTAIDDGELSARLKEKYKGTPSEGFIEFITGTTPEIYDFNSEMIRRIEEKSVNEENIGFDRKMALEFGAEYLSTLNDFQFLELLRNQGIMTEKQYNSLTRTYREIGREGLIRERYQPKQWKYIHSTQIEASKNERSQNDDEYSL